MEDHQTTREEFLNLVRKLGETPRIIQQLARDLASVDRTWKPSENEWSVLEHVCHLKDIEQEGYAVRIEKLLHETQPFLSDIDGDRLAEERSYNSQDFDEALRALTHARQQSVQMIEDLTFDQLDRSGMFESVGSITLGRLLLMMREHDQGHLQDISRLREQLKGKHAPLSAASQ